MKALSMMIAAATLAMVPANGASIANDALEICFADPSQGFAITGIVNRIAGGVSFVRGNAKPEADFWKVVLSRSVATGGVERVTVSNRSHAREMLVENHDGRIVFRWLGLDLPDEPGVMDITAEVRLPSGDAASEWTINVANRSARWALERTSYPCLRRIVEPGEADVLMPYETLGARLMRGYNGRSRNRICQWGEYDYPGYYPPVVAYMIGSAGLYVAAHDPDARQKKLFAWNLDAWFETPVENGGVLGKAAEGPRYAVTIAAYAGDWWQAARRYRAWALKQKWCAKGPIAVRSDYPREAMSEVSAWLCHHMFATATAERLADRFRAALPNVKLGLRGYRWSAIEYGWHYPEFLPARRGVKELFNRLADKGWVVMPYVNARLWDTRLASWPYAQPYATMNENGKAYTESWGSGGAYPYGRHEFGIMCPVTTQWQNTLCEFAHRVVDEANGGAVYYDQAGCAAYRECRNVAHGHPISGGKWWADGYREVFAKVHNEFSPRGVAFTTEGTADCYMDVLDGLLSVTDDTGEDVPFWPAVYADYTTYFGTRHKKPAVYDLVFLQMARAFVWGVTGGWSGEIEDSKDPELNRKFLAFVRFANAREKSKEFLAYGTLLDELRPQNRLPERTFTHTLFTRSNTTNATWRSSAVIGAWWRNHPMSRVALSAVNITDEPQTVEFSVPVGYGNGGRIRKTFLPRAIEVLTFDKERK